MIKLSMFETSSDILNFSLAISVFGIALILGWILVYFLIIIKRLVWILKSIEEKMKKVEDFINLTKSKIENSSTYLSVLAAGVKEIVSYFVAKKTSRKK